MLTEVVFTGAYSYRDGEKDCFYVLLRAGDGCRLPITVGKYEAEIAAATALGTSGEVFRMYDFTARLLQITGIEWEGLEIDGLSDEHYQALVRVRSDGVRHEIRVRPVDGINLALRFSFPIYVASEIMQAQGRRD